MVPIQAGTKIGVKFMNGRTVRKLLMRNRENRGWGSRAYLTIRVPMSLVPTPCPPPSRFPGLSPMGFSGHWANQDESKYVSIHQCTLGNDPRLDEDPEDPLQRPMYFISLDSTREYEGKPGEPPQIVENWSYWTGCRNHQIGVHDCGRPSYTSEDLTEEEVGHEKAFQEWFHILQEPDIHPVLDALRLASEFAKSTNWARTDDGQLVVTFGVKWFYPDRKLRFASAISRAFRIARQMGLKLKV